MIGGAVAIRRGGDPDCHKRIVGEFYRIECKPPFNIISGKIGIKANYTVSYNNIKIRLQGYLKSMSTTGANDSYKTVDTSQDIFNSNPIETEKCGGVLSKYSPQLLINFSINIPPDCVYPTPFMSSNGSLTYKLVILLHINGYSEMVKQKVVKFMGFHNIIGTERAPFVDEKLVDDEKIASVFTVPNTKVIMGCNEALNATLKLNGKINNRVMATLKLIRNINYKNTKESKEIWTNVVKQTNQSTDISFQWSFVVPSMSRASYDHPLYSVQYFLKYEATSIQADSKKNNPVIVEGLAEIQVGTTRLPPLRPFGFLDTASGIQPSAPYPDKDTHAKDTRPSAPDEDKEPTAPSHALMDSSKSVMSLLSMLSLPPAYGDLRPRSGSVFSIETQPPCYDDL